MRMISRVYFLLGILLLFQCTTDKDYPDSYFRGAWEAEWLLIDENIREMFPVADTRMKGKVVFEENDRIKITAYGFDGCVFASDTAMNNLKYDFQDSLLHLINDEKEVVFSYKVKEKLPDQLTLLLMDDIVLTLRR